ncbi:hypothetical protein ACRAWG_11430 [Methylobacterium sp. P31]
MSTEPRSYIITIAFTSTDPEKSARVVNTVAREYLRQQKQREVRSQRDEAQRDYDAVSKNFGTLHPANLAAAGRLAEADARLQSLEREDGQYIEAPRGNPSSKLIPRTSRRVRRSW